MFVHFFWPSPTKRPKQPLSTSARAFFFFLNVYRAYLFLFDLIHLLFWMFGMVLYWIGPFFSEPYYVFFVLLFKRYYFNDRKPYNFGLKIKCNLCFFSNFNNYILYKVCYMYTMYHLRIYIYNILRNIHLPPTYLASYICIFPFFPIHEIVGITFSFFYWFELKSTLLLSVKREIGNFFQLYRYCVSFL